MATLLFSAIGTLIGGPVGGAIGAMAGQQVDQALFGGSSRDGPRLKELAASTSSYGSAVPRVFGRMRVPGTIIWSTDLVEHSGTQGGGKGKPSVTTYSYSVSFAVALASRPLLRIGRIWADGNLLRGAAGDLKVAGQLRFYAGAGGQDPDPLMAAAEGAGLCPAYRGLAYVVFEDLALGDFGNRIPALTFEVFADEGDLSLAPLFTGVLDDVRAAVPLKGVAGLLCEGALVDTLSQIDPAFPLNCDAGGDQLTIGQGDSGSPIALPEAAVASADNAFGAAQGYVRKRLPQSSTQPKALRYYDLDRDFQPGLQRAPGPSNPGATGSIDVPMAMAAPAARELIATMALRGSWARQTMAWRMAELDPAVAPGVQVRLPDHAGLWRVADWEWRDSGVELNLTRAFAAGAGVAIAADPGRLSAPSDALAGPTIMHAYELPWDGTGSGDSPLIFAAAGSATAGWAGAALFADRGDGQLLPLGSTGRTRAIVGTALGSLSAAKCALFDRHSSIVVQLASADQALISCSLDQLANGANRALLGEEIIQFLKADPLGSGRWKLSGLLRGRAGSEAAIVGHAAGEAFVLLDTTPVALDPAVIGDLPQVHIAAIGLADDVAATSSIACRGITRRPFMPVHPRSQTLADGGIALAWTRRARGAWGWLDGVDTPLQEQAEAYVVTLGPLDSPIASWTVTQPRLTIPAAQAALLRASAGGQSFCVRQQGSFALSQPLILLSLS